MSTPPVATTESTNLLPKYIGVVRQIRILASVDPLNQGSMFVDGQFYGLSRTGLDVGDLIFMKFDGFSPLIFMDLVHLKSRKVMDLWL